MIKTHVQIAAYWNYSHSDVVFASIPGINCVEEIDNCKNLYAELKTKFKDFQNITKIEIDVWHEVDQIAKIHLAPDVDRESFVKQYRTFTIGEDKPWENNITLKSGKP